MNKQEILPGTPGAEVSAANKAAGLGTGNEPENKRIRARRNGLRIGS